MSTYIKSLNVKRQVRSLTFKSKLAIGEKSDLIDVALSQIIILNSNIDSQVDVTSEIAHFLSSQFLTCDSNFQMSFDQNFYIKWPLKVDKKKDIKRSYQTGTVEIEGEKWSFMVKLGNSLSKSEKCAKTDDWFKFFVIKHAY